jgi:hypothetical protein
LGKGEDALAVIPLQFLLAHTPDQADVVGLDRLRAAPLLELADMAVAVEYKPWRLAPVLESPQFPDDLLCLPVELRVQPNLPKPGVGPRATSPALATPRARPEHRKGPSVSACFSPVMVKHGEKRWSQPDVRAPLQRIETGDRLVLERCIRQQRRLPRRSGRRAAAACSRDAAPAAAVMAS